MFLSVLVCCVCSCLLCILVCCCLLCVLVCCCVFLSALVCYCLLLHVVVCSYLLLSVICVFLSVLVCSFLLLPVLVCCCMLLCVLVCCCVHTVASHSEKQTEIIAPLTDKREVLIEVELPPAYPTSILSVPACRAALSLLTVMKRSITLFSRLPPHCFYPPPSSCCDLAQSCQFYCVRSCCKLTSSFHT